MRFKIKMMHYYVKKKKKKPACPGCALG